MERKERFQKAFEHLVCKGLAHRYRDISERMKATPSNVSRAFKGDTAVLTDNFLRRFNAAYNNIFNTDWLLFEHGEMLASTPQTAINQSNIIGNNTASVNNGDSNNLTAIIDDQRKQINRLIAIIEKMTGNVTSLQ